MEDIPKGVLLFLLLLPATLVAVLRGDVGADTLNYIGYFNDLRQGSNNYQHYEPGFHFLLKVIDLFGLTDRGSIALVSLLTILLLCISFSRNKQQFLLFCWVIFPIYFVDMTMNGLRYGLGFALAVIAIENIYKKKYLGAIVFSLLAILTQYSSFLLIIPFIFVGVSKKYAIYIALMMIITLAGIITAAPMLLIYLYDKQDAYKDIASPGITSGLLPLLSFFVIYFSFIIFSNKDNFKILHILLCLELLSFGIAKMSYAGLRLQTLFLFGLLVFIKENFGMLKFQNKFMLILYIYGIFSFLLLTKNLSVQVEGVESPMIPYKFFWNER
ncbi:MULTISPECIES: EpsG family protein [unclassified Pedobacter]|uniref:EpsG family protein n=1 Tax=unclassified Pedobacter TaxID=2628915 RepID=UPI001E419AD8|nr:MULTISPECIES: EpsG family protein [unclassified Pedobacter]